MLLKKSIIPSVPQKTPFACQTAAPGLEIPYFQFSELSCWPELNHAVFTRYGGASSPPFDTLNCSYATADSAQNVTINLERISHVLEIGRLFFLSQIHGTESVMIRNHASAFTNPLAKADALITNLPKAGLLIRQADCQAVILFDPRKKVIANVHCGWRGNVQNILGSVVQRLQAEYETRPVDIRACIGPSLGPCCGEFRTWREIFPPAFKRFMVKQDYFDLWAVSRWQLMQAGLKKEHIETAGLCTKCRSDLFFSYRRGDAGRFATVVMLA